jgi:hypothetical protein
MNNNKIRRLEDRKYYPAEKKGDKMGGTESGNIGTGRTQVGQISPKYVDNIVHACEISIFEFGFKIRVF